ncbi:MAG TPA: hypothetical protein V6C99_02245 [Oculatellaceae cyanobacterium]
MKDLKAAQRHYRMLNRMKGCEVMGCSKTRKASSQYCANHARRTHAYGHPNGRPVTNKELKPYRELANRFLEEHREHKATQTAVAIVDTLIDKCYLLQQYPDDPILRELLRLYNGGATGREVLERLCAVWLYAYYHPRWLPDDIRLTFALSRAMLQTKPQAIKSVSYRGGRERRTYQKPGAVVHMELGQLLRDKLGIFFINMIKALEAKEEQARQEKQALAEPFTDNPSE